VYRYVLVTTAHEMSLDMGEAILLGQWKKLWDSVDYLLPVDLDLT